MTAEEVNKISKIIPPNATLDELEDVYTNPDAHDDMSAKDLNMYKLAYSKLDEVFKQYPDVYYCVKILRGIIKSTGVHAGGVLISGVPFEGNIPMELSTSDSAVLPVTQIDMEDVHYYSILKIDALGLSTCDIVKNAMDAIGLGWDWYDSEDYNDPKVYEFLRQGHTQDIFQMAKPTPTRLIRDFDVKSIAGLIAVNACNRPGPLQKIKALGKSMVDMYIEGVKAEKNGRTNPNTFEIPEVDDLLKDTYGCIIYQEQCMQLGQILAKYNAGASDSRIRKILGEFLTPGK